MALKASTQRMIKRFKKERGQKTLTTFYSKQRLPNTKERLLGKRRLERSHTGYVRARIKQIRKYGMRVKAPGGGYMMLGGGG